ncbi:ArsR/SmtB family transcription factor [Shewanella intestini]|uniref:Winged helix-turn-helix transcriptional regulator n=1 Tax=Shewanella intestini TaxID=2017544 RepID=A0ABS5I4E1_9GAMM|nr:MULTISPECIES: metalloregulator ArsR/SmtB family transcription factor [Shewanella]MBR9728893.1 winged helix-turn-helix transcriptional regulator [Shewanella intestini]MRG37041.1 metalloregulator ArsR/SmtB family transcription factor [Shewanella sp. XMDDZSB0408]
MKLEEMQANAAQAVNLLKAMGNENRLMILCLLHDKELSVTELNQQLAIPQSSLSQQLGALRREGFVNTRRASQTVYYSLSSTEVIEVIHTLHKLYCK